MRSAHRSLNSLERAAGASRPPACSGIMFRGEPEATFPRPKNREQTSMRLTKPKRNTRAFGTSLVLLASAFWGSQDAFAGSCSGYPAAQEYTFSFNRTFTNPNENAPDTIMPDAFTWQSNQEYPALCTCVGSFRQTYFTARTDLEAGKVAVVNSQLMQFFKVNRNIQIAAEVWIGAGKRAFVPIPFFSVSNERPGWDTITCPFQGTFNSGSEGKIHLMIVKPFVGTNVIPSTKLLSVFATTGPNEATSSLPMATVFMSGSVTVPQSCELPTGQDTTIDFGPVASGALAGPGETPMKTVKRTFQIRCKNISDTVKVQLSLEARPHVDDSSLLATEGRQDLGIRIRNLDRVISPVPPFGTPTNGNFIPLAMDYVDQSAQFDLEAWPVVTSRPVKTGPFQATATLKFEFE